MPNTAQANIVEVINQFSTPRLAKNIYGMIIPTKRGKINDPSDLITSWEHFQKLYGGLELNNDGPLLAKRALDRGAQLRVCNVRHYTDISNGASMDATKATNATSVVLDLSVELQPGHVMSITVNGVTTEQVFNTDSLSTLNLIGQTIARTQPALVERVQVISGTKVVVIPKPGVTLTVSSAPTGSGAPTVTAVGFNTFTNGTTQLFKLKPKYAGADYNNVITIVTPASNGDTAAFDLQIVHLLEPNATETYPGLKIIGKPNIAASNFLERVARSSYLVEVEYLDLSLAPAATLTPLPTAIRFTGGSNGTTLTPSDFIGHSASRTGFYAFSGIDDLRWISAPDRSDIAIHLAGDAYVSSRGDLEYHAHLSNNSATEEALIQERDAIQINSTYTRFFAGGLIIVDPITGQDRRISEMGDVAGIIAYSSDKFGPWYSASGPQRGLITNAKGVVNNFGALSNIKNLNRLANRQINTVILRDNKIMLWGNFTATTTTTNSLQFANVRSLLIELKKTLLPFVYQFIEEPNDIPTWKNIYGQVKPYLDSMVAKRAVHQYSWQGDQFADSIDTLQVNNKPDVQLGKYRVIFFITEIVSLQDIRVEITLSPSGVSFEDTLQSIA